MLFREHSITYYAAPASKAVVCVNGIEDDRDIIVNVTIDARLIHFILKKDAA